MVPEPRPSTLDVTSATAQRHTTSKYSPERVALQRIWQTRYHELVGTRHRREFVQPRDLGLARVEADVRDPAVLRGVQLNEVRVGRRGFCENCHGMRRGGWANRCSWP